MMRYRIRRAADGGQAADVGPREGFTIARVSYPPDWLARGGAVPGHDVVAYDPPRPPPPPPPARWRVDYLTLLDRLPDANAEAVAAFVEGQPAKRRERIRQQGVWSDDQALRARLAQAGEDPDRVLAL
jgi:hypothetical protein